MQRFPLLASRLRPAAPFSGAAFFHPPLALLPSEKTEGCSSTVTKTTTPSKIAGFHSLMTAAV